MAGRITATGRALSVLVALAGSPRDAAAEEGRLFLHVVRGLGAVDLPWDTVAADAEGAPPRVVAGEATLEVRPDGRLTEAVLLSWLVEAVEHVAAPAATSPIPGDP